MKHVVLLKSRAQNNGGLEKYASRIARAFANLGSRISVLTTGKESTSSPSISVYPFKTIGWPSFIRMEQFDQQVSRWIEREKPDLVFGMDRNRFQTHFRAGNGVHIAYLKSRILTEGKWKYWACLMNPLHRKILELEKTALENPRLEKIIANSYMVRKELLEHYNVDEKKIEVIHNGVEWHEMSQAFEQRHVAKLETAKKFGLDPHCFHFLFIGNGYLRKGLAVLLESLARLKTREFHLSVIGKDNQIDWFQAKAIQLGLKNNVRFFGPLEYITPFYQLADALVIPSFYDPFANVTIEALAMGLFVVSSKQNGGHEILRQENGIVVENNVDHLSVALETCLSHKKTEQSAVQIRNSVSHLDFSKQLEILMRCCE